MRIACLTLLMALLTSLNAYPQPESPSASATPAAGDSSAAARLTRKGLALGDHSAAEFNYYVQALQADSRYAPARIHLAGWLRAHNREDEALRQYLAALAVDPNYSIGHFALAEFLWHSQADPSPAEGAEPRADTKPSVRRMELARYHLQHYLDLIGEDRSHAFFTEARIMLAAIEGDLAKEKSAEPLSRINWEDAAMRLSRPADPSKSPYEGPRVPLSVEFERGSDAITHGSTYLLDAIARALSSEQLASSRIMIEGHADSEGDSKANLELSRKRAQSVRDYFVSRGLEAGRFLLSAYGEQRPLVPNDTPEMRQKNRRIEVVNWDLVQQTRQRGGLVGTTAIAAQQTPAPSPTPAQSLMPEVIAPSAIGDPVSTYAPVAPNARPVPTVAPEAAPTALPNNTSGWEIYQYPSNR